LRNWYYDALQICEQIEIGNNEQFIDEYRQVIYSCYYDLYQLAIDDDERRQLWSVANGRYMQLMMMISDVNLWSSSKYHPNRLIIINNYASLCNRYWSVIGDDVASMNVVDTIRMMSENARISFDDKQLNDQLKRRSSQILNHKMVGTFSLIQQCTNHAVQ
jgi:hypothetical protein